MKRRDKVKHIRELFEKDPDLKTYFATYPDCKLQSDKGKVRPGYNVQSAVDDKIETDSRFRRDERTKRQELPDADDRASRGNKKKLGVCKKTKGVADCGYFSEKNIIESEKIENVEMIVAVQPESKKTIGSQSAFTYDRKKDVYICPDRHELKRINKTSAIDRHGRETNRYRCDAEIYKACPHKSECTKSENSRMLRVSINHEAMLEYLKHVEKKENKRLIEKRKEIVKHPFETIKKTLGITDFMLRGIEKVRAEFSFICFIYNLKRVLNTIKPDKLNEALVA
jgi:hypothetical protein